MPKLTELNLQQITEWLEGPEPPTAAEAGALFSQVIPALLDLEVAKLHAQSLVLLEQAHALAGLSPSLLDAVREELGEEGAVPPSCESCEDAQPAYSYGAYRLLCLHGAKDDAEAARRPALAEVDAERAFKQPAKASYAELRVAVQGAPPPPWCPRR